MKVFHDQRFPPETLTWRILKCLGIRASPAFVGEPDCNGLGERFMGILKEECTYVTRFCSLEHAGQVLVDFIGRYNREWLLERHGYMTPAGVRESFIQMAA